MAHMIEDNMIAYKNQTPWHGLGTLVNANATGNEMLAAAKMDWEVKRRQLAMRGADGTGLLTAQLTNYRAIVRSDNDHVFNIATDSYQIVQNSQIIDLFREYCEAGHASMETVGAIKGGAIVWALAKLNGATTVINGIDQVDGYVLLMTSHDGTIQTIGKGTQIRVVCWNTLSAALHGKAQFKMKHSTKWTPEKAAEAKVSMGLVVEQMQELNAVSEKLAKVSIDDADWLEFMAQLIGKENVLKASGTEMTGADVLYWNEFVNDVKHGKAVQGTDLTRMAREIQTATVDSPGAALATANGTLWGAVNGVTYYADHMRGRTQDNRLTSAWAGDSEILKTSAMRVAVEMAGIK